MHVSHLLSLVAALPLATAVVPPYPRHVPHGALGKWIDFKQNSQFDFQPFSLTKLGLECDRKSGNDTFDCELSFDWHDPNSVRQNNVTSCTCTSKWSWDGATSGSGKNTAPTKYALCRYDDPNYFQMRFVSFGTAENFTLSLAHHYQDSENFTEPYIYPTTFAEPELHLPVIKSDENLIRLYNEGPVNAEIIGLTS